MVQPKFAHTIFAHILIGISLNHFGGCIEGSIKVGSVSNCCNFLPPCSNSSHDYRCPILLQAGYMVTVAGSDVDLSLHHNRDGIANRLKKVIDCVYQNENIRMVQSCLQIRTLTEWPGLHLGERH